ncbi:MAG: hypothetical protein WB510_12130, partial [Candidatus Sulfotelmatobacter sp.]
MNLLLITLVLTISAVGQSPTGSPAGAPAPAQSAAQSATPSAAAIPADDTGVRKAKALLNQAIQALGGQAYLDVRTLQQTGRTYTFFHGRPTGNGVLFWRFVEYPDKERIEVTKERDVAYVYAGEKGYEITYRGPRPMEAKDLNDYLRRRKFSLETVLRIWVDDPRVALFYEGTALAGTSMAD